MKRRSTSHSSSATLQKRRKRQSPIARILTELRRQKVILSDPRDLRAYLKQHSRLARHLPAVCERTRAEFGPATELELKVTRDPEVYDPTLALYVRVVSYGPDFMDRIDHVSREFDDALYRASGFLFLTSNFRLPKGRNGV